MPGEFDFIDWVRSQQRATDRVPLPAGDDLAAMQFEPADGLILVGVDQILDGVHFDSRVHEPERIGRKAMNRNLSDCAAMACLPAGAVVSFALPRGQPMDWTKRLYDGIRAAGDAFDCPVVGGDTGVWAGPLAVTVSVLGRQAGPLGDTILPVRRSGAVVGDAVYVTGPLGGSILGRHLDFVPRVREARAIAAAHAITAMIDLSDGLSRDAAHIARESGAAIVFDAASIPVHADVARLPPGQSPLFHALNDGEDYELCFTGPADVAFPGVVRVGTAAPGRGVWIDVDGARRPVASHAFEHRLG